LEIISQIANILSINFNHLK